MFLNLAKLQRWLISGWWSKKFTEKSCLGFDLSLCVMLVWISFKKVLPLFCFSFSLQPYLGTPEGLSQLQWLQSLLLKWETRNNALNSLCGWGIERKETWVGTAVLECVQSSLVSVSSRLLKKTNNKSPKLTSLTNKSVGSSRIWVLGRRKGGKFWSHLCAKMQPTFHKTLNI